MEEARREDNLIHIMIYPWDIFFKEKITKIFENNREEKKLVVDIGGGLRVVREKNNRYEPSHEWIRPYFDKVDYKIMDPVDTYNPDIVGDIHAMPFADNSHDAIICIAVLEHVEDPLLAMREMYRVLKPGGYLFIYVPFLYYYHAEKGYYGDFWRFTKDSLAYMAKPFSSYEIQSVRGAFGTLVRLSPLGRINFLNPLWYWIDVATKKIKSNQVSGYNMFLTK
jgi:SAM-dependent methyltransferase